jgi:hypothetical protein
MTQGPNWIERRVYHTSVRRREIEPSATAQYAVRFSHDGVLASSRKVFDNVEQACGIERFITEREVSCRSLNEHGPWNCTPIADDDSIHPHVPAKAFAQDMW